MDTKIRYLPASGKAIVVSDLHGHLCNFEAVLKQSCVMERMLAGEDVYLILMGDVCDVERHKSFENDIPFDGDIQILERLMEMRRQLQEKQDRIIYLEGNHDFHILRIFQEMEECGITSLEDFVTQYRENYGEFLYQNNMAPYDMIYRVQKKHLEFIESSHLMVVSESGIVIVHAGPIRCSVNDMEMVEKIAHLSRKEQFHLNTNDVYESCYFQLLCNRYCLNQYTTEDIKNFLQVFHGNILISGHTPLLHFQDEEGGFLPGCDLYEGMILISNMQVVLATSFGAYPGQKKYLELDLVQRYASPIEWKPGKEIFAIPD